MADGVNYFTLKFINFNIKIFKKLNENRLQQIRFGVIQSSLKSLNFP